MKYSYDTKVYFSDLGCDNKLSLGTMIDYLQNCTNMHSDAIGRGIKYQLETGRAWMLCGWRICMHGTAQLGDQLTISTWATGTDRLIANRCFTISKDGVNLLEAESDWFIFDTKIGRIAKLVPEDTEPYEVEEPISNDLAKIKISSRKDCEECDIVKVQRYQLDFNGHMNNAWYVKLAQECLGMDDEVSMIRVEYKRAAKYGDLVRVCKWEDDKICHVELRDNEEQIYSIIVFERKKGKRND